ncbi:putative 2-isopropylmalate synthase B-like [Capsicum annuum]|nr:putative 2-isopropylmalate synthase B-like [Capsicum annuum]
MNVLGVLKIKVRKGINLAIRDTFCSDPYVVITMGGQKAKTRVIKENCNPVWNEELSLALYDPNLPIILVRLLSFEPNGLPCFRRSWDSKAVTLVDGPFGTSIRTGTFAVGILYDKDTFTSDDKMGDAKIDIKPYLDAINMGLEGLPDGVKVDRVQPNRENCLSDESCILWENGKMTQIMLLRLQHVECGEVEIQIELINAQSGRDKLLSNLLLMDDNGTESPKLDKEGSSYPVRPLIHDTKFKVDEETTKALACISFSDLKPTVFVKDALFSIDSEVGKPIHLDATTSNKTDLVVLGCYMLTLGFENGWIILDEIGNDLGPSLQTHASSHERKKEIFVHHNHKVVATIEKDGRVLLRECNEAVTNEKD